MICLITILLNTPKSFATDEIIVLDCSMAGNKAQIFEYDLTASSSGCKNTAAQFRNETSAKFAFILQRKNFRKISVTKCYLKVSLSAAYCGSDGFYTRVFSEQPIAIDEPVYLTRTDCIFARDKYIIKIPNENDKYGSESGQEIQIPVTSVNRLNQFIYLSGKYDKTKASCEAASFRIRGHDYESHWLKLTYSLNVQQEDANYFPDENSIVFKNKAKTAMSEMGYTIDSQISSSVFVYDGSNLNNEDEEFSLVNQGWVTIHESFDDNDSNILIFRNEAESTKTAIIIHATNNICLHGICYEAFSTYMPGIFIITFTENSVRPKVNKADVGDLSIYAQLKGELQSAMILNKIEIDASFQLVAEAFCELQRNIIKRSPSYAMELLKSQNVHNIIKAGSILYFQTCVQKIAVVAMNTSCYQDLPIRYTNAMTNLTESAFVNAVTNTIVMQSTVSTCSITLPNKYNVLTKDGVWKWICFSPVRLNDDMCSSPDSGQSKNFDFFKINLKTIDSSIYTKKEVELMATRSHQDAVNIQSFSFNNLLNMNTAGAGGTPPHSGSAENTLYNMVQGGVTSSKYMGFQMLIYLDIFIENIQYFLAFAYLTNVLYGLTRVYKIAKNEGKFIFTIVSLFKALTLVHIELPRPIPPTRRIEPLILKDFYDPQ